MTQNSCLQRSIDAPETLQKNNRQTDLKIILQENTIQMQIITEFQVQNLFFLFQKANEE